MAEVLLVDDDANNRLLLTTLLKHAGHAVHEAADGASALELAGQKQPDLIVVDLTLPDMPGTALMKELRTDTRLRNAKIALYTATRLDAAAEELADLYGVCAVIPKPGDPRQILQIFEGLLT